MAGLFFNNWYNCIGILLTKVGSKYCQIINKPSNIDKDFLKHQNFAKPGHDGLRVYLTSYSQLRKNSILAISIFGTS